MVASYFHVKPCLGKEMTKKAVREGLSNSGVMLLATHGKVDEDYPYGCLVLQGPTKPCDVTCTSASISAQTYVLMVEEPPSMPAETPKGKGIIQQELEHATDKGGHDRLSLFEGTDVETRLMKAEEADQVLTAAEIATLENGICAELVVLSACESHLGQATASEGLLGLGRALLQAGAATAILTLWKVDDLMTSRFVASLFHELLIATPKGRNVSECLRMVMLQMIQDNAPFTIVGSPAVRLFVPNDNWEVSRLDKFSHVLFPSNDTCQLPCRGSEELQLEKLHIILDPEDRLGVCPDNIVAASVDPEKIIELLQQGARIQRSEENDQVWSFVT